MPDEVSLLRHSIRGTINALKLGVSAMGTGLNDEEAVEFLEYIIQASDKMCTLLDHYDKVPNALKTVDPAAASFSAARENSPASASNSQNAS
jgi:hypothetical protein